MADHRDKRAALILDNATDYAIISTDLAGTIQSWNEGAERLFGWLPSQAIGQKLDLVYTNQDIEDGVPLARRKAATTHHQDPVERWHKRKDGALFWASGDLQALYDEQNRHIGFLKIVRDRTRQRLHDEQIRLNEERLRLSQQAGTIGTFEIDRAQQSINVSATFCHIMGLSPQQEISFAQFLALITSEEGAITALLTGKGHQYQDITQGQFAIMRENDGAKRFIHYWSEEVALDKSPQRRIIGIIQDVTSQRLAQEKSHVITRELAHRVKNILAIVQSIANQTLLKSADMETAKSALGQRLKALALIQDTLIAGQANSGEIKQIITESLNLHSQDGSQISYSGENITLGAQQSLLLALAMNELATNAIKYGALSSAKGRVEIGWHKKAGQFHLTWQEFGGPATTRPAAKGFGSKLIEELLPASFSGKAVTEFNKDGFRLTLSAPVCGLYQDPIAP